MFLLSYIGLQPQVEEEPSTPNPPEPTIVTPQEPTSTTPHYQIVPATPDTNENELDTPVIHNEANTSLHKSEGENIQVLEEENDLFIKILRAYIFPFFLRFHTYICWLWLAIFVICIIYGPAFLSKTRSDLQLPDGAPSKVAINAFVNNYPDASLYPPAFIISHSKNAGTSIVNGTTTFYIYNLIISLSCFYSNVFY